ncbi:MAG TPA: hypothetical protein VKW09_10120 [bacterium]|nr:hypothetical protein [bacterium]
MIRGSILVLLAAALVLTPAARPADAAPSDRFLVVPGYSAGPVDIGMKLDAVQRIFGRPSTTDLTGTTHWYQWQAPDNQMASIAVETLQDTVVLISLAHDPRYRTSEGIGDGNTLDEVRHVFGRPSSVMRLSGYAIVQFRTKGIGFVTDGSDHVTGIVIAPAVVSPPGPNTRLHGGRPGL